MLAVILTVTGFFWLCLYAILGDLSVDNTNCNVGTRGASLGTYYSNDCSDSDSSSNDSYSSESSSYDRYNGPKTLPPPGAYDVLFDIDNDGQMSAEEVYLQTKNREHMENDTSNGFWW